MLYYNQKEGRKTKTNRKGIEKMKNWKVWMLIDENGKVLARGRKRDVMRAASLRYVYDHIFTDSLYQTSEPLN